MEYRGLNKLNDAVYLAHKGDDNGRGAQIVFLRGLQFQNDKHPFPENWLSEDGSDLWPKSWLSQSFPNAAIYLVDYDSSLTKDDKSGRLDMFATAESVLHNLFLAEIGQSPRNPVILIGQDIGGLVIKEMCLQAFFGASLKTGDTMDQNKKRSFLQQVKGVFYYSTPHGGIRHWDQAYQGELMERLTVPSKATSRNNEDFRKMREQFKWRAFGLGASHQGKGHVEEASARNDVDQFCMIAASTMDICRPKDRKSSSFLLLKRFIGETVSGFTDPNRLKLPFKADPRYVPLEHTLHKIRQRLKDPDVQVVVLYGDAGTGKSSLTMYLALQFEEESMFPDGIFYFPVGRGKGAVSLLRNMLRQLHVHDSTSPISSNDEDEMHLQLRQQLQNRNALVILDDVWDDERLSVVEKVVVPGAREVKYLFSSQQSGGWKRSGYSTCEIEPINLSTAQQIIIKHVGLLDDEIPEDDAETVNEIIGMTDFHPLALATISGSVRVAPEGRVRRGVWKDLRQSLLFYLAEDHPAVYVTSFSVTYPRSVFAAMMYAVDLLFKQNDKSLYLLCIMALFEGPFPTSLIHMIIFCTRPGLSRQVSRLIGQLRDRQLVQHASTSALQRSRVECFPESVFRNPYAYEQSSPCYLKMHSLRQRFILTCAEYDSSFKNSVEVIKETLAPFLSGTNFRGAHEFEHPEEHPKASPAVLITAFCALYGVSEVQNLAQRKIPVRDAGYGLVNSRGTSKLLILPADTDERSISTSLSVKALDVWALSGQPRICLEVLMLGIEEHSTSTSVQCALQKVVWDYMFELQIDDDNLSFLISEGYDSALTFLMHQLPGACPYRSDRSTDKLISSVPRSLAAAASLLRNETQSSITTLMVLNLLQQLADHLLCPRMSVNVDVIDVEVLINVFFRVHDSRLDLSSVLLQIFCRLAECTSTFQLMFLRTRPGMQEVISSVIEKLVADLNTNWNLELVGNSNGWYSFEINHLITYVIHQVDTVLRAEQLVCDLWPWTFGVERVLATLQSISKPLQALVRLCPQDLSYMHCAHLLEAVISIRDQTGRSVIWSIPGATQAIAATVNTAVIQQRCWLAYRGLNLLYKWSCGRCESIGPKALCSPLPYFTFSESTILEKRDSVGTRISLFSKDFIHTLIEVIGDFTNKIISASTWSPGSSKRDKLFLLNAQHALGIITNWVAQDDTAASVCASLPKLHRVLCDLLSVVPSAICTSPSTPLLCREESFTGEICSCLHRSALTVLLYLGHSIGASDDRSGCCILQPVTTKHSESTVVEASHEVKVQNAFESLFEIFDNNGQRVAHVAALELLGRLLQEQPSAWTRIADMPTIAATRLFLLLHGDVDAGVQELALDIIRRLVARSDRGLRFMREMVLIPGALERMLEFMGFDWGGRGSACVFVARYLETHPKSASRILAVRDVILSLVVSLQNQDQDIEKIANTLYFLLTIFRASGSVSFFLSIRGSVEAVVELLAHRTPKLVKHGQRFLRTCRIARIRSCFITGSLDFLILLATQSDEAVNRMVATGDVFDLMIDLVYNNDQWETVQGCYHCAGPCHETQKMRALEALILLASRRRNALPEKITELVSRAFQDHVDLLTNISGARIPGVLKSLVYLLESSIWSRHFVLKAPRAFESLISLCVHHDEWTTRNDALNILRLSLGHVIDTRDNEFTPCVLKVLGVLPEIVDQLRPCPTKQKDCAELQLSVLGVLGVLTRIGYNHNQVQYEITARISLIINNPQVLQHLAGFLQRFDHHSHDHVCVRNMYRVCKHNMHAVVMYILTPTVRYTSEGMFLIVQIPGTLERIVELVYRQNYLAYRFVYDLITTAKFFVRAPRYLLKCLVYVDSTGMWNGGKARAPHLLEQCALRNQNALHHLIDMLHESVRCTLRDEAMNYLISHVSDHAQLPTRTILASLQSLVYDPSRHECLGPARDLQVEVLCLLVSLVERSPQIQWRIAKYVTGLSPRDLRMCMRVEGCDEPREEAEYGHSQVKNYSQKFFLLLFSLLLIFGMTLYTSQKT